MLASAAWLRSHHRRLLGAAAGLLLWLGPEPAGRYVVPEARAPDRLELIASDWRFHFDIASMDGSYALLVGRDGLEVAEIDGATPPRAVATIDIGMRADEVYFSRVVVDGERGYAIGRTGSVGDWPGRILVALDLQRPRKPWMMGRATEDVLQATGYVVELATSNRVVWLTERRGGGNLHRLHAVSMTDPANPRVLAVLEGYGPSIAIRGDLLFTQGSDGRVIVLDIEHPAEPRVVASLGLRPTEIALDGPRLVALVPHNRSMPHLGAHMEVWDIEPPHKARLVGRLQGLSASRSKRLLALDHRVAFLLQPFFQGGESRLVAIDLRRPGRPAVVAGVALGPWNVDRPRVVDGAIHVHGSGDETGYVHIVRHRR